MEDGQPAGAGVENANGPGIHGAIVGSAACRVSSLRSPFSRSQRPERPPRSRKQDRLITMSDGVKLATTYYVPDGAPPAGGWPAVMLLPRPRRDAGPTRGTPVGMSLNRSPRRSSRRRATRRSRSTRAGTGSRKGSSAIDGPREIQDVRELFDWLAAQPGIDGAADRRVRLLVRRRRDLARDGRRRPVRRDRAGDHVDRPLLRARAAGLRPLGRRARLLAVDRQARAAPGLEPIVNDRSQARISPRSTRSPTSARLARSSRSSTCRRSSCRAGATSPSTRPGADGLLAAEGARSGSTSPTSGTRLPRTRRASAAHVLPEAREWFDRYLKGLPNGIDRQPPIEIAPDPWTGRTFHYRALPKRKTLRLAFPGRESIGSTGKVARTRPRLAQAHRDLRRRRCCASRSRARTAGRRSSPSSRR